MYQRILGVVLILGTACQWCAAADETVTPVERGEYLVQHVAMCIYCHTPKDTEGQLLTRELLAGAAMPVKSPYPNRTWGFRAPNLRSLPKRWGTEEFVHFLETGETPNGYAPRLPMPPFRMTKEDATAVAAYLNSLQSLD